MKRNLSYLHTHARPLRTNVNEQKLVIEQCHGLPLTSKSNHMELRVAVAKDFCGKMVKKKKSLGIPNIPGDVDMYLGAGTSGLEEGSTQTWRVWLRA